MQFVNIGTEEKILKQLRERRIKGLVVCVGLGSERH